MTINLTFTPTITKTFTISIFTFTNTPTETTTVSQQPTITVTPVQNIEQEITDMKSYPNPVNPDRDTIFRIGFKIEQKNINKLTINIYTAGFRFIKEITIKNADALSAANNGFISVDINELKPLANGTYYYYIKAFKDENVCKSVIDKMIVLR